MSKKYNKIIRDSENYYDEVDSETQFRDELVKREKLMREQEKKNPIKVLYYCEKGLQINENYVSYWKRNALLNKALGKYQEAEVAFQNTIELGNYELSVWMDWLDTLIFLNEWEKGHTIGQQAKEFYPEECALDYKIAGCFYKTGKSIEMEYYLQNVNKKMDQLPQKVLDLFPQLVQLLQQ